MSKPQTDREELKELDERARKFRESIDGRANVQLEERGVTLTPDELAARKRRNLWIALFVGAFMALVFAITLVQMQAGVLERPL
jgi:hypothetical protein